jgi:ubiquinone/menaquinone biosynthesis C-methylase UbiE
MPKFINPGSVIAQTGLRPGEAAADLGCGAGFYAIPAAKIVGSGGQVFCVDILDSKLAVTQSSARQEGLKNTVVIKADLEKPLDRIAEGSCDLVILASILHEIGSREALVKNAYRVLKTGGKLLVVEWKKEFTPLGPPLEARIAPEDLVSELAANGLRKDKDIPADSFHYAMLFIK